MIKGNQRKLGVMLSYLSQGIQILSGLIYTPIMLRLLGQSEALFRSVPHDPGAEPVSGEKEMG